MKTMGFAPRRVSPPRAEAAARRARPRPADNQDYSKEAKALNFYNWTEYIDKKHTIPNFEKRTGIKVTYDNYSSNDDLFARSVRAHGLRPHRAYRRDAREDQAREPAPGARLSQIPNLVNLDPPFPQRGVRPRKQILDSVAMGTTGIGLRQDQGHQQRSPTGCAHAAQVKGKSSYLDEARRIRDGPLRQHQDPNTLDDKALDDAKKYLIDLRRT